MGSEPCRSSHLWVMRGVERVEVEEIAAGDIVFISGPEDISIGDTFSSPEAEAPALPPLEIEEPTVSMFFLVNTSPLAGSDGRVLTLRQIKDRLDRELRVNVALRVEDLGRADGVKVSGRGELHLGILIEEMRREGIELCVSRPEVITRRDEHGKLLEPIEQLMISLPEEYQGMVIEKLAKRKGEITGMTHSGTGMILMEYEVPTRGLIGYRSEFLTDTRGLGIMSSRFIGYGEWRGEVVSRTRGSMIATEPGDATAWQLENLQPRGTLFVSPMDRIYQGMVVGESARPTDLPCNPCKKKQLTNHRQSTKEIDQGLDVPRKMSLDAALAWIAEDELVEVTPTSIRLRKAILDPAASRYADKKAALATAGR
jgi:GTP-binding protein